MGDIMILKSLYLRNYRTYRGPEEVIFATGDKNVTIIQGNNEVGKTTIMNAITWCLYGVEYYRNEGNEPIWSKSTSYDLENGDEDHVEVKLTMEDSKGKTVEFIRTLEFYKNDFGECRKGASEDKILVDGMPVSFKNLYISKHLPKNIREYFLFDGEQLEKYFKEDNKHIKNSVYQLSQLDLLKKVRSHLSTRQNEFNSELKQLNPSLGHVLQKEKDLNEKLEDKKKTLAETNQNIAKWEHKIKENEELIAQFGEDPSKWIDKKKSLVTQLKNKDIKINKEKEEYNKFVIKGLPKILSINSLLDVKSICEDLEEKGYIPARFKKEFLEYLLEQHECICGADLSEGTDAYNKMKELYDKTDETTNIADTVNLLLGSVNNIINNFPKTFKEDIKTRRNSIVKLNNERDALATEITEVETLIGDADEDKIKELQSSITTFENLVKNNSVKIGKYEEQIKNIEEELSGIKEEIKKEEAKTGQKTDIETSIAFCKSAAEEISRIYDELEVEMHQKLQDLTSEEFGNMHWKEFYNGVSIDNEYNVTIHKEGADVVPNDLSKGGQLVLALSFMTALNSLSGFELPIIIDTPLGRLDEPIKENIGKYLPQYTRKKQVTLLVTSSEYSVGFREGIKDYVGKEYTLEYIQEKDGITTIEQNI